MVDFGNPAGFDVATVLTGSGLTLLISAAILQYGDELSYSEPALYGVSGAVLAALGVAFGLALVVSGYR
ncbi:hypothetical protein [Salinarchaeum laminariae]|uniref:hypothetical protein n=1 Tax=Salinarchaeum laminariae TaxID=869888 RepID=UPI0020BD7502|nr:hypothetical protein [Salinarchaeum laminariae]